MTFISLGFIIFLTVTVSAFYICPVKNRWIVLLVSSIIFYVINGPQYIPFILATILTVFFAARSIGKIWAKQDEALSAQGLSRDDKKSIKQSMKKKRKRILVLALLFNLAVLCVIKFAKFYAGPVNSILTAAGSDHVFSAKDIIVPLGISYYTFSTLSYLLDVYWKRYEYEKSFARFALYTVYFPHILQGPIENYSRLGKELKKEFRFDSKRVLLGFELMLWGFFKKLVIADRLNIFVTGIFGKCSSDLGLYYLIAAAFSAVSLYADFSGCMDIARGISQIFGIELDLNFERPFFSTSVTEFWRRWHITLGVWFRDYVYYPISTSSLVKRLSKSIKKTKASPTAAKALITALPVGVTWILTGLWHGTGKNYIAWGIYYAVLIFLSTCFSEPFQAFLHKLHIRTDTVSWRILQSVKVFLIFMFGRLLTAPGSLHNTAKVIMSIIFRRNFHILSNGTFFKQSPLNTSQLALALAAVALLFFVSLYEERTGRSVRERIAEENLSTRVILMLGLAISIAIFGVYGPSYSASSFAYMAY